jgi:hypothetical protein
MEGNVTQRESMKNNSRGMMSFFFIRKQIVGN